MKIYFDNVLIDEDYYTQCSQTGLLFNENDTFKLGSTVCRSFTIGVDKNAISELPTSIELEFNNVRYTQFRIDKYEENDVEYIFYLVDRMIDLDFKYDASEIFIGGKTTLKAILDDICSKIGITARVYDYLLKTEDNKHLTTENESILKTEGNVSAWWQDKEINWYDNKITAREYIGMIAELNGGYAIINNNNEMEIRTYNNNVVYELNSLNCDTLKVGNRHEITKVVYDFGIYKYEAGTDGETLYINQNNKFITSQEDIDEIYNLINGFEFYTITNQNAMIGNADIGECIRVDDEYLTIVQINNWKYNVNTWIGGYNLNINSSTLEGSIIQETFTEEHIKELEVDIDRANNQIVLKATEDGHISQVQLGTDASEGSSFNVLADNINLEGYTTINGGFSIDDYGNPTVDVSANNYGTGVDSKLTVKSSNSTAMVYPDRFTFNDPFANVWISSQGLVFDSYVYSNYSTSGFRCAYSGNNAYLYGDATDGGELIVSDGTNYTDIKSIGIWSPQYNNNSLESKKKNIELDDGCLEQILDTDICSFNWKYEDDTDQKHIGCIIADKSGNYYVAPKVLTHDKDAIDLYSMSGMSWKAIQELYDIIKLQQDKINELEERLNGIN